MKEKLLLLYLPMAMWMAVILASMLALKTIDPIEEQECDHTFVHGRYCIERIIQPEDITEDRLMKSGIQTHIPVDYCYDCGTLRVNVKYRKP